MHSHPSRSRILSWPCRRSNKTEQHAFSPELVVRVPGEAELFSGGEIPIELRTLRGPHVEWKPYGLSLKLKTLEMVSDRVRLELASEISDLDRANAGPTLPALTASRMKTQVDARIGEGLFLSGLLQDRSYTHGTGLPWFRNMPVLGSLFGSNARGRDETELVAVLLPLLEPPRPPTIESGEQPGNDVPSRARRFRRNDTEITPRLER
jgi:Flp pilus assembly secretin CpaC